jgi:hypothetical protein
MEKVSVFCVKNGLKGTKRLFMVMRIIRNRVAAIFGPTLVRAFFVMKISGGFL